MLATKYKMNSYIYMTVPSMPTCLLKAIMLQLYLPEKTEMVTFEFINQRLHL